MNINEVLYLPVKREGLNMGPDEFDCKCRFVGIIKKCYGLYSMATK